MNVTPSSVNAICAITGRSVIERIASTASAISARSENVSTTKPSTPPSSNASACSRKTSRASSAVTAPSGSRYFPSGPIEPRTQTSRPAGPPPTAAGWPRPPPVDVTHLGFEAVHGELEAVGAERVGLDRVGAGGDVVRMDALHDSRIVEVQHVEARVEGHPARVQHSAH